MKKLLQLVLLFTTITTYNISGYAQQNAITLKTKQNKDNSIEFSYEKTAPGSYTVMVEIYNLLNAYHSNFEHVVKLSSGKLFTLHPIDKNRGISFNSSYSYTNGIMNPKVDSLFVYTLPFQKGKIISVYESNHLYHDIFNAELPKNWKAYHFKADAADTIFAARKGMVVKVNDQFETDTISFFNSKKNYITLEHADGSFATYTGFAKNNIFVKPGQTIYPQTPLGNIKEPFKPIPNNFSFMVYYLTKEKSKQKSTNTNFTKNIKQVFITPYFNTEQGILKLEHYEKYNVAVNADEIQKEMTKSEKKKLNKLN